LNFYLSVTFGNGLFVAVADDTSTNIVITSPDGITWTPRIAPNGSWFSVTYGNGIFVAVGNYGSASILTSPDGITWTARSTTAFFSFSGTSVTFQNALFVAVGDEGKIISSPDGINWTLRSSIPANNFRGIGSGNGLFIAFGENILLTSPDSITWTSRTFPSIFLTSITFGNGYFVGVGVSLGGGDVSIYSTDGITWTSKASLANEWESVTFANNRFVAVALSGNSNRVMTLDVLTPPSTATLTLGTTKGSLNLNWTNGTCTILPSDVVQYEFKLYLNGSLYMTQILTRNSKSLDFQPAGDYYYTVDVIKNESSICSSATSNTVTILPYELDYDF
jgi:hypothetical protein